MAFVACPGNFDDFQVDHIDNNPSHNIASNLRWMTRKDNNSRQHSRMMKSKNHRHTMHKHEKIMAVNKD